MKCNFGFGRVFAVALAAATTMSLPAKAEYPEKPVEMTVLFGGTANTIAQLLSDLMSQNLPNPVVPVARKGGGGAIGYTYVQGTRPDGYNVVFNSNSINTAFHLGTLPFNFQEFTPIAAISVEIPVLAVNTSSGWNTVAEMVEAAKASDSSIKVGISGKGSFTHLASAALFDALGIGEKVNYISYGDGKAPVELLAGRIDAAIQWPGQFVSYVKSGDLKVLVSTSAERVPVLPDVPTAAELGLDLDISMWRGLAAPKGTPPEVIAILEEAARKAVASDKFIAASKNVGFEPSFKSSADFGATIQKDDAFYGTLIKDLASRDMLKKAGTN